MEIKGIREEIKELTFRKIETETKKPWNEI